MKEYTIKLEKDECIACSNCYLEDPLHFESDSDGYAQVVGGKIEQGVSFNDFKDGKIVDARAAAESCPVEIIKVEEKEDS